MNKETVREQFGANAAAYLTRTVHAKGASLGRLVELVKPQPEWNALDVAAAAGHTAFAFAPHVRHVWATDITPEMLALAREEAGRRGLQNVTVELADAENLPYDDGSFDLVTCRIAPHHFPDVGLFLREGSRALRPGGVLGVVDNVVPEGAAGDYVNAFEKLRDPSHNRCLSMREWRDGFLAAGLEVQCEEILRKQIPFEFWAARHDPTMQRYLRAMLSEAADLAAAFLEPQAGEEGTIFHLTEGIFVGRKP